jgi:hypothetical protein
LLIARLVLATNENDVLDEFFRTGIYRPRTTAETQVTSSPSMDISKASNFERFIFDLLGRDPAIVQRLRSQVDAGGSFDFNGTPFMARLSQSSFSSGRSSHADRLATIRDVWQRHGSMIDTHTADGVKVAQDYRQPAMPMIVLETAQPVKFAETIRKALGRDPVRPVELEGIEALPQQVACPATRRRCGQDLHRQTLRLAQALAALQHFQHRAVVVGEEGQQLFAAALEEQDLVRDFGGDRVLVEQHPHGGRWRAADGDQDLENAGGREIDEAVVVAAGAAVDRRLAQVQARGKFFHEVAAAFLVDVSVAERRRLSGPLLGEVVHGDIAVFDVAAAEAAGQRRLITVGDDRGVGLVAAGKRHRGKQGQRPAGKGRGAAAMEQDCGGRSD